MSVHYGLKREDGSRRVWFDGKPAGVLRGSISQATIEASPGIQSWSNPRGKVCTKLMDTNAVADFAAHWARKWQTTYPLATGE